LGFALISLGKNGQDISRTNLSKHWSVDQSGGLKAWLKY
jgi:hypothetical protein